jgi:energy-coupling factor transporter ATP-binding protein EcfA2
MPSFDWTGVEIYDWVPFFRELANKLVAIGKQSDRDTVFRYKCTACFEPDAAILRYDEIDPMSFVYYLAQKNTVNQRANTYEAVKREFELESTIPTDWIFPTPTPNSTTLYHDGVSFATDQLWHFFSSCAENQEISSELFESVLRIKNVGLTKLTQTMFIVNPERFLPYDRGLLKIPGAPVISGAGTGKFIPLSSYNDYLNRMKDLFPGCEYREINLFGYLLSSGGLRITGDYFQIGSNVYNDGDDYHDEFHSKSAVWVGGPRGGKEGKREYNLTDPRPGDVMLPHFSKTGNGVGVLIDNEYAQHGGFDDSLAFRVVWINKESQPDAVNNALSPGFSRASSMKASFQSKYEETFRMLDQLSITGESIARLEADTVKNLVLQGPPGSGKTRLAKQLAAYLQDEDASLSAFLADETVSRTHKAFLSEPDSYETDHQVRIVQFHPGYTYEDFVRGISTVVEHGVVRYQVSDRIMMEMVTHALAEPTKAFVLIIDEMNRANLPSVLGELIYALEYRGEPVSSIYAKENDSVDGDPRNIVIPNNLYVIGTMNTADRSIGHIDYAIRRRFVFRNVLSDESVIGSDPARALYRKVSELFDDDRLSPDLTKSDVMVGHSYFLENEDRLIQRLELAIKPLLREYVRDGILVGPDVDTRINNLSVE